MTAVDELIAAGIPARAYGRGPLGKDAFVISINRRENPQGLIRIFEPQNSEVEVIPDKKRHQAVLNVTDPTRKMTRKVQVHAVDKAQAEARAVTGTRNPFHRVTFPRTPRFSAVAREMDVKTTPGGSKRWDCTVTATVPMSRQSFLVGMDETANFVAMTKEKRLESVDDAHAALRPTGIEEGTQRQGEWFFAPLSDAEWGRVEKAASVLGPELNTPLENGSSHRAAQLMRHEGNTYAIGYILDDRHGHHAPLFLDDWHKVTRNGEVPVPAPTPARRGTRRRSFSQSWD